MWPDLQKPRTIPQIKIFCYKALQILVYKHVFTKNLLSFKSGDISVMVGLILGTYHLVPYNMSNPKIFSSFLYSNLFISYRHLFTHHHKWHTFRCFRLLKQDFLVVSFYILGLNYRYFESLFHTEDNGASPISVN